MSASVQKMRPLSRPETNVSSSQASRSQIKDLHDERVPECLTWTVDQVADWTCEKGFEIYRECFESNFINGRKLIKLDASKLPQLGITDWEDIKSICQEIRNLLALQDPDYFRSISLPPRESIGMYLEQKSRSGTESDVQTYQNFRNYCTENDVKWEPALSNMCHIVPHDAKESVFYNRLYGGTDTASIESGSEYEWSQTK